MAVERGDSTKEEAEEHKFKISRRKYRWKMEQIIRFSFHQCLFTSSKKACFALTVPITDSKFTVLRAGR